MPSTRHAGGAEHAERRGEDAGDEVDEDGGDVLLLRVVALVVDRDLTGTGEAGDLEERVVDVLDLVPENNLILAVRVHDLDDAGGLLDDLGVRLAGVLQLEAKAG